MEEFEGEALERIRLEKEGKFMRKRSGPKLPSEEEVAMHCLMGHVNYRSRCEICVQACGKEWDHRRKEDQERKFPEYSFDYCFPGDEFGFKWTVLVGKELSSSAWMATTVPMKGSTGTFSVDKIVDFLEKWRLGGKDFG